ncbi:MAG: VOC family protein [Clostridium perfringens]|nr:VOC family protein [Clostridium perfringens]
MNLLWNTIHVNDLYESIKFYENILGLKVSRKFKAGPNQIAFLNTGNTEIELIQSDEDINISHGEHISLGFSINSVDSTIEELKSKGIDIYSGPFKPNPHIKFFFIKDPNGVLIQLAEQIK